MRSFSTPLGRWLGLAALAVTLASPALAQRNVTLRMNSATMPDLVEAGPAAGVQVRGNIGDNTDGADTLPGGNTIDWSDATTLKPTNVGGDYWEIDFQIPDNEQLDFKFYISQSEGANLPGGYEDGDNHTIAAGTGDVVRDLHYFNKTNGNKAYDWRPFAAAGDSVAVWFRVYVDTEDAQSRGLDLDDDDLDVGVRGSFGTLGAVDADGPVVDWGEGGNADTGVRLTRERTDSARPGYALFSGLAKFPATSAADTLAYKFYFRDSDTSGDGGYEGADNRSLVIPAAATDTTLHWVFYGDSPALPPDAPDPVDGNVTFQVDVSPLTTLGLFQTSDDDVQVRGGFNGWNCPEDNQDDCALQQAPGTADYLRQIAVSAVPNTAQEYKFYVEFLDAEGDSQFKNAAGEDLNVGWEEPLDFGGGNRSFTFTGNDQDLGPQFFNSVRPGNVIADGQSVDVTFQADMNAAQSFTGSQGRAFNPAVDTVTVQFEDVVWLLTQGYIPGSDALIQTGGTSFLIRGFKLTDPDGDGVYTGTLTVNGPTYNGIGYKIAYGSAGRDILAEGPGVTTPGRRRYRYITDTTADDFTFALDTFRPAGPDSDDSPNPEVRLPWETNPTGTFTPGQVRFSVPNGYVDRGNAVAVTGGPETGEFALGNVYPNPTAGTARVVVSGRADARVTVRVYDVTGRVVGTVAEDALVDGRPLEIDTRGLAAGLYLVRADSESGVATARLTVVR